MSSISCLMKLILRATVPLLFFLARRMLLFSLKIRLISLPHSSLNCSNAAGFDGGELQQKFKERGSCRAGCTLVPSPRQPPCPFFPSAPLPEGRVP